MNSQQTRRLSLALAVLGVPTGCADRVDASEPGAISRYDRWLDAIEHHGELECECIFADPDAAQDGGWGGSVGECVDSWLSSPVAQSPSGCTQRAFAEVDVAEQFVTCFEDWVDEHEACRAQYGCIEGLSVASECWANSAVCEFPPELLDRVDACLR